MDIQAIAIEKPDDVNVIVGQSHFIKTVEDLHEVLAVAGGMRFGIAFCESSGPRLVRRTGNDEELIELAVRNALRVAAGHVFLIMLKEGYPVSVLNAIKQVPEVCSVFCASANPLSLVVAEHDGARGVLGALDGLPPTGVEGPEETAARRELLRAIGYKL